MEVVVKSFWGIFCLMLLTVTGLGLAESVVTERSADTFAAGCQQRIEASCCSSEVIEACIRDAEKQSYNLEVEVYGLEEGNARDYGVMTMRYDCGIPFMGLKRERVICADLN